MKTPHLILILGTLILLLVSGTAWAMPAGEDAQKAPDGEPEQGDFFQQVVEKRRTAAESYQEMREERLEKLNRSAARGAGRSDRVPGWNLKQKQASVPVEKPTDWKGLHILLLVGAGVILSLTLRVLAPFLFDRKPRQMRAGEPMTIQLKPREERKFRRA